MNAISRMPMRQQNHLLAALPAEAQNRLGPSLELVHLRRGEVIHDIGEPIRHAYFPTDSIVAMLAILENGACSEVCMVGNEGVVGIAAYLGGDAIPRQAVVQNAGYAYRLPEKILHREFTRHDEMLHLLLRYTQALITQTAQTAMCNRHHSIDQQLCRLLLQSLDRLPGNELTITQETIANMLGVRRESITEAAGRMKALGLIECRRGRVKVIDRPGIEQRCCECYAVVRKESMRLLPYASTLVQKQA